jgi:hypothetical protein
MHTLFAGSATQRKAINLSGHRTQLDKDELMKKTMQERRLREQQRQATRAATTLQVILHDDMYMSRLLGEEE